MILNIRHLRIFLEVAKCKSISQASKQVFLSQPAITQAIAKLETVLDTTLFDRRSDGMYVTSTGQVFALRVSRAISILHTGIKDISRYSNNKTIKPTKLLKLLTMTQLKALIAVTNADNFSVAAKNIGISQSSLHRAARDLESLLELVLFEKSSIGINSTKAAKILAKASKLAFTEIAQGQDEVNILHNRETSEIVIGSMPLARTSLLPKAIVEFSKQYPDCNIKVIDGPYNDLLYHLCHGDIDFLLGALRFPVPTIEVSQETLFSPPVEIVANSQHPLFTHKRITPTDLLNYPWVVPLQQTPTRNIFESLFTDAGLAPPKKLVETSSQILMRSLLIDSDRLTLISTHQIELELKLGILKTIPYQIANSARPIGIACRTNWKPTKIQQAFLKLLRTI